MLPAHFSSDRFITVSAAESLICDSPSQCLITLICLLRKLYWTDGDNISMANMDGSNQTTLFTNQKGPVGEQMCSPEPKKNAAAVVTRHGKVLKSDRSVCNTVIVFFHPGLSIDYEKEQLYWISSGNSTISRCQLDGSKLEILEGVRGKLTKATALAIMGKIEKIKY